MGTIQVGPAWLDLASLSNGHTSTSLPSSSLTVKSQGRPTLPQTLKPCTSSDASIPTDHLHHFIIFITDHSSGSLPSSLVLLFTGAVEHHLQGRVIMSPFFPRLNQPKDRRIRDHFCPLICLYLSYVTCSANKTLLYNAMRGFIGSEVPSTGPFVTIINWTFDRALADLGDCSTQRCHS